MSEELKNTQIVYGENVLMMRVDNCLIFGNKNDLRSLAEKLTELPSAEPERKWIPVTERLPLWSEHVNDMVLVCYGNGSIRFDTYMHDDWVHGNPIAWMPLPEPFKG